MHILDQAARLALLLLMIGIMIWTTHGLTAGRFVKTGCQVGCFFAGWMGLLILVVVSGHSSRWDGLVILGAAVAGLVAQWVVWAERHGVAARLGDFVESWPARMAGYPPPKTKRKRGPRKNP